MPRDRLGTFEPATIPKHVRRLDGLSGNIISLYTKGMTTGDIQTHLGEIYGTEISPTWSGSGLTSVIMLVADWGKTSCSTPPKRSRTGRQPSHP